MRGDSQITRRLRGDTQGWAVLDSTDGSGGAGLGMKYHDEFLSPEPPDPQLPAEPQMRISKKNRPPPPTHTLSQSSPHTHTAPGLLLAGGEQALFILPRGLEAQSALARYPGASPRPPSSQTAALTHPHSRVQAARGPPGRRQVPRSPRHSLCPRSHSPAGPGRQPPGPPRQPRGPRSPTTRRSQSHQPFSPRVSRSVRLALGSARRVLRTAPGGRDTVTGVPREPTSAGTGSAQRARTSSSPPGPARLSLRCGREELGRECGDVTGRGRGPAGRPEVASQRPQEGGSKTAAKPEGPGGRDSAPTPCQSAHFQDTRTPHSSDPSRGEADWTKGP